MPPLHTNPLLFTHIRKMCFSELKLQLQSSFEESSPESEQPDETAPEEIVIPVVKINGESEIPRKSKESEEDLASDLLCSHSSLATELSELRQESRRYQNDQNLIH